METPESRDDKCQGDRADASPPTSPLYEYIKMTMQLCRLPPGTCYHEYRRKVKDLEKQIMETGVTSSAELDRIICFISKFSWDFEDIAGQLRAQPGKLTQKKVLRWFQTLGGKPGMLEKLGADSRLCTRGRSRNCEKKVDGEKDTEDMRNQASASVSISTPLYVHQHTQTESSSANHSFIDKDRLIDGLQQRVIHALQQQIVIVRREQFNHSYVVYDDLMKAIGLVSAKTRGSIGRLLPRPRNPNLVSQLDNVIRYFPPEIPYPGLPKTIEILTKSSRLVRHDYYIISSAFKDWLLKYAPFELLSNELIERCQIANETWDYYDARVARLELEIRNRTL